MRRAEMNAGAMAFGKNVLPKSSAFVAAGIVLTVAAGRAARMLPMGLYPRKAANNADVGEMFANAGTSCGAPALTRAEEIAPGKLAESAPRTIVKNTARLIVCPTFCNVAR